ncbi:MAG TPA: lysylphosphatidylglycerol synthase domain-containing protein [Candidatus Saccharimonadales bacterium]|nr:lysylphosphatidylglycerol synthase domain-containing protein [Candidatus Saccharimonadales bacterium]
MKRRLKAVLMVIVLLATIGAFTYYFVKHPEAIRQLGDIAAWQLALIFGLYLVFVWSIALILEATVTLCRATIPVRDSVLITMWSSIINFFGPLQSGPAFRAVYLKKVHGISLKNYGIASLLYYGFYAAFSGLFLVSGLIPWPVMLGVIVLGIAVALIFLRLPVKLARQIRTLPLRETYKLALATLIQVSVMAAIYTVELKSIDSHIAVQQAIVYTGAANFALFVSLTPGAIGFREAFLVFSENLHHIDHATILAASVLDRSAYIVLLGVLFLAASSMHLQDRFTVKKSTKITTS